MCSLLIVTEKYPLCPVTVKAANAYASFIYSYRQAWVGFVFAIVTALGAKRFEITTPCAVSFATYPQFRQNVLNFAHTKFPNLRTAFTGP